MLSRIRFVISNDLFDRPFTYLATSSRFLPVILASRFLSSQFRRDIVEIVMPPYCDMMIILTTKTDEKGSLIIYVESTAVLKDWLTTGEQSLTLTYKVSHWQQCMTTGFLNTTGWVKCPINSRSKRMTFFSVTTQIHIVPVAFNSVGD